VRFEQLRFFCAVVDSGFSITRASEMLHISQPAVSKQMAALEAELGTDILVRASGRIVGLTAAGHATLARARQILLEVDDLVHMGKGLANEVGGKLVIATTHTHARYALLDIIKEFRRAYPYVHLHLVQANPSQVYDAIATGAADIGISSEEPPDTGLRQLRGRDLRRSIIAPVGHPVFRETPLSLKGLSKYSLLTLDASFPGGRAVVDAFEKADVVPNIVMTFDRSVEQALEASDVTDLFGTAPSFVLVRPERRLPAYMADFINRVAPGGAK
jgi:LysR family transcriptional regulator, cys regulon transcriptional activator